MWLTYGWSVHEGLNLKLGVRVRLSRTLSLSDVKQWRNLVSTFHAAKIILRRALDAILAINVTCIIAYLMFYILILTA